MQGQHDTVLEANGLVPAFVAVQKGQPVQWPVLRAPAHNRFHTPISRCCAAAYAIY